MTFKVNLHMSKLDRIRIKLSEALRKGNITKEIHDQVLEEALAKHRKEMTDFARKLAELELTEKETSETIKSETIAKSQNKMKVSKNWLVLGMFSAGVATLVSRQLLAQYRTKSIDKDKKSTRERAKPAKKKK